MTAPADAAPIDALVAAIKDYEQADEEGIRVRVSRQACDESAAALLSLQRRVEGYQGSRDYAIDLLAKALGIEPDKVRAVEYYARLASERIAELKRRVDELQEIFDAFAPYREIEQRAEKAERRIEELEERARIVDASISCAAMGHYKRSEPMHDDYKTVGLNDVLDLRDKWRAAEAALATARALIVEIANSPYWSEEGRSWAINVSESLFDRIRSLTDAPKERE